MDTEGLHSSQRTTDVDLKIFALSVLLSSSFILNQIGPISEGSLTDLHLIANLVKFFGQKKNKSGEIESQHESFPDFYWCLRDFHHDIDEFDSANAYMEDCLKPVMGVSKDVIAKNRVRKSICNYFPKRECIPLVRPVDDESVLAHIEDQNWEDLKAEFRSGCSKFIDELKQNSQPKALELREETKFLNAQMLLGLAMDFCEAVNDEETPKIESSVSRVLQEETRVIADDCFFEFQTLLDQEIGLDPTHDDIVNSLLQKCQREVISTFQLKLSRFLEFDDILEETKKFKQRLAPLIQSKQDVNYTQNFHYSRQLLEQIVEEEGPGLRLPEVDQSQLSELCQVSLSSVDQEFNHKHILQLDNIATVFESWHNVIR